MWSKRAIAPFLLTVSLAIGISEASRLLPEGAPRAFAVPSDRCETPLSEPRTTITFWHAYDLHVEQAVDSLITAFQLNNPDIGVTVRDFAGTGEMFDALGRVAG
jgi:ABC-type glycerol-3-phosphate transport system substrate-binding protein